MSNEMKKYQESKRLWLQTDFCYNCPWGWWRGHNIDYPCIREVTEWI